VAEDVATRREQHDVVRHFVRLCGVGIELLGVLLQHGQLGPATHDCENRLERQQQLRHAVVVDVKRLQPSIGIRHQRALSLRPLL
jgi:hypothetical protein